MQPVTFVCVGRLHERTQRRIVVMDTSGRLLYWRITGCNARWVIINNIKHCVLDQPQLLHSNTATKWKSKSMQYLAKHRRDKCQINGNLLKKRLFTQNDTDDVNLIRWRIMVVWEYQGENQYVIRKVYLLPTHRPRRSKAGIVFSSVCPCVVVSVCLCVSPLKKKRKTADQKFL